MKCKILSDTFPAINKYPFNLNIFHKTKILEFPGPVTFFVGENGTGKSTLLEAIAMRCDIHIWRVDERMRYEVNLFEQDFYKYLDIQWDQVPGAFFASEIFKDFAKLLDEWAVEDPGILKYFGGHSLMTQSHGQSLMSFFKSRFKIKGLYLLDEPETALSPQRQLELVRLLKDMTDDGHAQFIIATHSPLLMACPGARIYSFDHKPIRQVDYEKTRHFKTYKKFLNSWKEYFKKG